MRTLTSRGFGFTAILSISSSFHKHCIYNKPIHRSIITTTTTTTTRITTSLNMFESRELFGKTVKVQIPADVFPTNEEIEAMDAVTGDNCQHGWYKSSSKSFLTGDDNDNDGPVNLHYRYWLPPGNQPPKGVVIFYMGIMSQTGHASRIDGRPLDVALVVDTFTAKGMAVYAGVSELN
jgi:hypothetical protein